LWLVDEPEIHKWAMEKELLTDDGSDWDIPVLRINVQYREQDEAYNAIQNPDSRTEREMRDKYLKDDPAYATARREREAYQMGISQGNVSNWIDYNDLPDYGFWKERYRRDNPDFDSEVKASQVKGGQNPWADVDTSKIPSPQYDMIFEQYRADFEAYEDVQGTSSQRQSARESMLASKPEFRDAMNAREAYGEFYPDELVGNHVEVYRLPDKGWERERYYKAHPEFYLKAREIEGWKEDWNEPDKRGLTYFDKIPSEQVERELEVYDALPTSGKQREAYRKAHPELDDYLVRITGLKPLGIVKARTTEAEFIERFVTREQEARRILAAVGIR
jgi:hypothetical protein